MCTQLLQDSMIHILKFLELHVAGSRLAVKLYCLVSDIYPGIINPTGTETPQFFSRNVCNAKKLKSCLPLLKME